MSRNMYVVILVVNFARLRVSFTGYLWGKSLLESDMQTIHYVGTLCKWNILLVNSRSYLLS